MTDANHRKKTAVLVEDLYEDLELWVPALRLKEEGHAVELAGPEQGRTYTSKHGYPVESTAAAGGLDAGELDLVVIPGGYAPDRMRRHAAMVDLVREAHRRGAWIAWICHGGWMACSADILKGRTVTSFFAIRDDLVHAGAEWVDREVVRDGPLISARTPDDLPAFCREMLQALQSGRPGS